uniref:Uncharacterized protein n=1 Tax=Helianthus annuus TaxID=4232 RepID=A0A251TD19_HELAN
MPSKNLLSIVFCPFCLLSVVINCVFSLIIHCVFYLLSSIVSDIHCVFYLLSSIVFLVYFPLSFWFDTHCVVCYVHCVICNWVFSLCFTLCPLCNTQLGF